MAGKEVIWKTYMGVVRSTYIIDEAGTITHVFEKSKAGHRCTKQWSILHRHNKFIEKRKTESCQAALFYCHIKVICCLHVLFMQIKKSVDFFMLFI